MKKISLFFALMCASVAAMAAPVASGELYSTYQKQGDRFYKGDGEADLAADYFDWNVNYYIVACGDSMWLRVTTTEERNLNTGWQTQLRVWNASGTYDTQRCEIQVDEVGDTKNRYTASGKPILAKTAPDLNIHVFLNWENYCTTQTFGFNRASINNPISDSKAPVINPAEVTMAEVGDNLVFTFGAVTADDEYFYYVGDKDHNVGGISLTNKVTIPKPTVNDGVTYTFRCYAVDYNGNKSASKAFTLTMPFDPSVNLALNKPCEAGAVQNDNIAGRAVDGDATTFWTCFGQGEASNAWWIVDLGSVYTITKINLTFNDLWGNAYSIYASSNKSKWTAVAENVAAASQDSKSHEGLSVKARYFKVTSPNIAFGIKEFEAYGSGIIPTGIETVNDEHLTNGTKMLIDGQLVIIKNGVRYNAMGGIIR